jgi:hypothetical protein
MRYLSIRASCVVFKILRGICFVELKRIPGNVNLKMSIAMFSISFFKKIFLVKEYSERSHFSTFM